MKLLLTPLVLCLLSAPYREDVALEFAPAEGTVLKPTFVAEAEYRLADLRTSVAGNVLEAEELPDYSMKFVEHIAVTDTLGAVADGRPTELVRAFDDLRQENTDRVGDEESEST